MVSYLCLMDRYLGDGRGVCRSDTSGVDDAEMGDGDWVASPVFLPRPLSMTL